MIRSQPTYKEWKFSKVEGSTMCLKARSQPTYKEWKWSIPKGSTRGTRMFPAYLQGMEMDHHHAFLDQVV